MGEDFLEELNDEIDDLKTTEKPGEASKGSMKNITSNLGNLSKLNGSMKNITDSIWINKWYKIESLEIEFKILV